MNGFSVEVCLVSPLPPPYGGISHWTSMIEDYSAKRSDINLVVVDTAPRWRAIHKSGVLLRAFGGGLQLLRDASRLVVALTRRRFHAVHLTTSGHLAAVRDLLFSYIASIFGVGFVYHIRFGRIPVIAQRNSIEWIIIRRVMLRASKVILIDNATFSAVRRFAPDVQAVLVPNCVNTSHLPVRLTNKSRVKTALFIGWVIPTKGVAELVEAWAKVRPSGWRLEIVGPGSPEYQAGLLERFTPENIDFVGALPHAEAMKRMANCDLFVLPSYTEGFPNVVAEAMALGRPILATDVGAIPEMLEGDAGVLVKSKDSHALAHALTRLVEDSNFRDRIGERAFERAMRSYTIDVVFNAYMDIWRGVSEFSKK